MTYLERLKKLNIHQGSTDKIDKSTSVSFGSPSLAGFWPCDVERHLRFAFPDPHSGTLFADPAQAHCGKSFAPMCTKNFPVFGL